MKKIVSSSLVLCVGLLFWSAPFAAPLDQTLNGWDMPVVFQGAIMEHGPDYIVISEVRIQLVDEARNGRTIRTSVRDLDGKDYGFDALRTGAHVVVKGGAVVDPDKQEEVILAREIYITSRPLSESSEIITKAPLPW